MIIPGALVYDLQALQAQETGGPAHSSVFAPEALDSLVAPIGLYPDPLLAQVLAASTYPLQIVDANRWFQGHKSLHGQALLMEAAKQDWEPSVQAMVLSPSVLKQLDSNLKWTTALGNAVLAQEQDVMLAVQRQRQKAYSAAKLHSDVNQNVQVRQVEGSKIIVIQPSNPAVAGWGWICKWGSRPTLYVNNTFIRHYGFPLPANISGPGFVPWTHNPYHRGAVPYPGAAVANRYGAWRPAGVQTAVATPRGHASRSMVSSVAQQVKPGTFTNPTPNALSFSGADHARVSSQRGNASIEAARGAWRWR